MDIKYRVVKERAKSTSEYVKLKTGVEVVLIEESDPDGDWPNWILCRAGEVELWVPKQIIQLKETSGIVIEDYDAVEFDLNPGEIIIMIKELNGWIWGYKSASPDKKSWAPLNCLEIIR